MLENEDLNKDQNKGLEGMVELGCAAVTCQKIGTHRLAFVSFLALGSRCTLRLEALGWHVLSDTHFSQILLSCCIACQVTNIFLQNEVRQM